MKLPFSPGRTDASQKQTDVHSFAVLEPKADGFRNYLRSGVPLTGGRTAGGSGAVADADRSRDDGSHRRHARPECELRAVQTRRLHQPARDVDERFLRQPARHEHEMAASATSEGVFEGRDRATGETKWTGTRVDLVFGSNSQLRAIAEVYACDDSKETFVKDFASAWNKVMNLDRFDLALN